MGLYGLVLSVLLSFLKIDVISTYFKLTGYSELDKALLKVCNMLLDLDFLWFFEVWEAFLSLSKTTSLKVSS